MRRRALSYGLVLLAASATAGGVAVRRLLDRPGETAFAFLPENALAVAAIDVVPAPDQVLAFKNIEATLSAVTDGKAADPGAFVGTMFDDPVLRPLAEQIDRSAAGAWLPNPSGKKDDEPTAVGIVAIKDPAAVARILTSKARRQTATGTEMFRLEPKGQTKGYAMLHGNYVVFSDKAWAVDAVARVIRGEAKSIVGVPAFASAGARALPSASLRVLAHPSLVRGDEWLVGSMSIRETGMDMAVSGDTNDPEARKAGSLAPLSPDLLAKLPRGAYGFLAAAQSGPAVALFGDRLDDAEKSVKDESDLDLEKDVLPALGGNAVVGLYPSYGPDAGLDLLVSIDDANGAAPAAIAARVERAIGKTMEEDKKDWKVNATRNGATISRLADEPTDGIQDVLRTLEKSGLRPLTLSRGKTVAWASVGQGMLLATSQELLDRAIAARRAPSDATGLSGDLALGTMPARAADGQFALAIGMKRLVEGIRNTVDPSHMTAAEAKTYRQALSLYDATTEPLAIRAGMDPNGRYKAFVSIPFDWSKLPSMTK